MDGIKAYLDQIFCYDSANMSHVPNHSVDLIITSPPYNADIDYDTYNDSKPLSEYLEMLYNVWNECYRVLKPGGRICINVANINRKPYIPLNAYISQQMIKIGFLMRGEIIWNKTMGHFWGSTAWGSFQSPSNPCLRDSHEYIMVFCKDEYGLQEKGETDLYKKEFEKLTRGEWNFNPIHANHKLGHPAPFPEELPKRCIKLYSWIGATILDPFCGSGTTCFVAKMLKRHYIGYDLSPKYCQISRKRCSQSFMWNYN